MANSRRANSHARLEISTAASRSFRIHRSVPQLRVKAPRRRYADVPEDPSQPPTTVTVQQLPERKQHPDLRGGVEQSADQAPTRAQPGPSLVGDLREELASSSEQGEDAQVMAAQRASSGAHASSSDAARVGAFDTGLLPRQYPWLFSKAAAAVSEEPVRRRYAELVSMWKRGFGGLACRNSGRSCCQNVQMLRHEIQLGSVLMLGMC